MGIGTGIGSHTCEFSNAKVSKQNGQEMTKI